MDNAYGYGEAEHGYDGGAPLDAEGSNAQESLREITEELAIEQTEEYGIERGDGEYLRAVSHRLFFPIPFQQDKGYDAEDEAVPCVTEYHPEKHRKEYPDKRCGVIRGICRQGQDGGEEFEGLEVGRIFKDDRDTVKVRFFHLLFIQHHPAAEGIIKALPQPLHVTGRHPAVYEKTHPRLVCGRGCRHERQPVLYPFFYPEVDRHPLRR